MDKDKHYTNYEKYAKLNATKIQELKQLLDNPFDMFRLTPGLKAVAALASQGLSGEQIGQLLQLKTNTVFSYMQRINSLTGMSKMDQVQYLNKRIREIVFREDETS